MSTAPAAVRFGRLGEVGHPERFGSRDPGLPPFEGEARRWSCQAPYWIWRRSTRGEASCHNGDVSIEQWWPTLQPSTREWLIANNGDAVPAPIVEEIAQAGGAITSEAWWVGQNGPSGFYLSDAAIDWIEEIANGETPQAP